MGDAWPFRASPGASARRASTVAVNMSAERQAVFLLGMLCRLKGNLGAAGGMRRGRQSFMPHLFPAGDRGSAFDDTSVARPLLRRAQ